MSASGKKRSGTAIWLVAGIAVVVVGGLVALSTLGGKQQPAPDSGAAVDGTPTQAAKVGELKSDKDRGAVRGLIGRPDAPFKLVEYSDFL